MRFMIGLLADFTPPSSEELATNLVLAAASDLPKQEDLAKTIDVQLTPAIRTGQGGGIGGRAA